MLKTGRSCIGGTAALPIWIEYMRAALKDSPQAERPMPPGLVIVKIDLQTGQLASAGQRNANFEYFKKENVPRRYGYGDSPSGDQNRINEIF